MAQRGMSFWNVGEVQSPPPGKNSGDVFGAAERAAAPGVVEGGSLYSWELGLRKVGGFQKNFCVPERTYKILEAFPLSS